MLGAYNVTLKKEDTMTKSKMKPLDKKLKLAANRAISQVLFSHFLRTDLTYAELAACTNIPLTTVYNTINGKKPHLCFLTMLRLCSYLGVSLEQIREHLNDLGIE